MKYQLILDTYSILYGIINNSALIGVHHGLSSAIYSEFRHTINNNTVINGAHLIINRKTSNTTSRFTSSKIIINHKYSRINNSKSR